MYKINASYLNYSQIKYNNWKGSWGFQTVKDFSTFVSDIIILTDPRSNIWRRMNSLFLSNTKTKTKDERRTASIERTVERRKLIFKTNVREKVARYVVQRQLTSYLHPNTASAPSDRFDQGKLRAQWKHHKIPEISICRRRRFSDSFLFGPPKQMKQQMKLKDADESENRLTKHKK